MTYGDLFTGFGGATLGAIDAGLTPLWGIEYDAKIAAVANDNFGGHVIVANILNIDPATLPAVDVLHASPPCPNFSVAKAGGCETPADINLARKVIRFVEVIRPRIFTLENVYGYRHSQSWRLIQDALFNAGYWVSMEHVNAADMGVPQTRQRMIVRAVRGGWVPYLPQARRWVGWYEAIEDLIPTLPASQFAPWQIKRLPEMLQTILVAHNGLPNQVMAMEPAFTVTADQNQLYVRAFLAQVQGESGDGIRFPDEPMQTVSATHGAGKYRAYLVDSRNTNQEYGKLHRTGDEPAITVTVNDRPSHMPRAWLDSGRVVAMTPRALARFQSFPDSYRLPDNRTLAARGIGNALPPLVYRRILEGLIAA